MLFACLLCFFSSWPKHKNYRLQLKITMTTMTTTISKDQESAAVIESKSKRRSRQDLEQKYTINWFSDWQACCLPRYGCSLSQLGSRPSVFFQGGKMWSQLKAARHLFLLFSGPSQPSNCPNSAVTEAAPYLLVKLQIITMGSVAAAAARSLSCHLPFCQSVSGYSV